MKSPKVHLTRRVGFSAAHRYFQKAFTEEKNREIFGRCYTPYGHGHNYVLEMTLTGEIDPTTGMVINLVEVDRILREVTGPLDHHHLNFDVPYFKDLVPTTENIAKYCFDEVCKLLPKNVKAVRARLFEAENLWADYYG
jgi:6-pyruvoyltetrahydropterin/6-carboxytetrahydropterin synthase